MPCRTLFSRVFSAILVGASLLAAAAPASAAWTGSGTTTVTTDATNKDAVAVSVEQNRIVYGRASGTTGIYYAAMDGSGETAIITGGQYRFPDINSSGQVVFTEFTNGGCSGASFSYVHRRNTAPYGSDSATYTGGGEGIGTYQMASIGDDGVVISEATNSHGTETSNNGAHCPGNTTVRMRQADNATWFNINANWRRPDYVNGSYYMWDDGTNIWRNNADTGYDGTSAATNSSGDYCWRNAADGLIYAVLGGSLVSVSSAVGYHPDISNRDTSNGVVWVFWIENVSGYEQVRKRSFTQVPTLSGANITISASPITADGSTNYTISITATDADGSDTFGGTWGMLVLMSQLTGTWTNAHGYFGWHPTNSTGPPGFGASLESGACAGGGYVGKNTSYGPEFVQLLPGSCSTTTAGNDRTVNFVFRALTNWGDIQDMRIGGYACDKMDAATGWVDWTGTSFKVLPAAPSGLSVTNPTLSTQDLSWTLNSGSTETSVKVYRNAILRATLAADTTSWQDTGLPANTQYTYQIKAANSGGESAGSNSVAKYTLIETPTTSTFGTTTASSIVLNTTGLSNLTSGSSGAWFESTTAGGNTGLQAWITVMTATATGLSPNAQYTYRVKARNGDGIETGWSGSASRYTLPGTPSGLVKSGLTTNSLTWSWSAPAGDANGYKLTCNGNTVDVGYVLTYTASQANGFGVMNANTSYTATVTAYNSSGDGITSGGVSNYTAIETPADPTYGTITSSSIVLNTSGCSNITVASSGIWFDSTTAGGNTGIQAWVTVATDTATTLSPNAQYTFRAKARNGDAVETPWSGSTSRYTLPGTPTGLAKSGLTTNSLTWSWSAPAGDANGYKLTCNGNTVDVGYVLTYTASQANGFGVFVPNTAYTGTIRGYNT
ncbi:MAG: hypothetical protein HY719_12075, partial [Planctomycetes bacterium]|nr:hypothetical protein [Planctomycetota bacterium]